MLSVLIPVYNEEDAIETTVRDLYGTLSKENIPHEILAINDRSIDQTEQILQKLLLEVPSFRYENNKLSRGFGLSIQYGLTIFQGDSVCLYMADSSESPDQVVKFYRKLQEGYDCVFGSRFIRGGSVSNFPRFKLFVNRLANLFIRTIFWMKYNDTTNAFKLYRRSVIVGVQPFLASHFNLTVELPLKAIIRGYSYAVLPTNWSNRKKNSISKLKIKEMGLRYLFIVLYCFLEKMFSCGDYKKHKEKRD